MKGGPGSGPGQGLAVLVVEDDEALLEVIGSALAMHGWKVLPARSPEEAAAREAAWGGGLPVVVADVMLRGARGPEAVALVRRRRSGVAAVYMSGYAQEACLAPGELRDGDAFVPKPFTLKALAETVRSMMSGTGVRG